MIIAGTGHRPDKHGGYSQDTHWKLVEIASTYIESLPEKPIIISGLALGWDQALAQAALTTKCKLWSYIPFEGQELAWPETSQKAYRYFLRKSTKIKVCSEGGYAAWKMQHRNKLMVDDSDLLLAMFNGSKGGTANCIAYAMKQKKEIVNLYEKL